MQGIVGRFMSSFGLTASFAIGVSLIVSFTLTPMLAARLIKPRREEEPERKGEEETETRSKISGDGMLMSEGEIQNPKSKIQNSSKDSWFYSRIDGTYTWLLKFSMAHRWLIVLLCALVFLSIVPLFMFVGKNFLPVDDQSQFEVSVRAPEGTFLNASRPTFANCPA
jgi:HAE1 family hydrophobic/amphiphilic exporter-1